MASKITETLIKCKKKLRLKWINEMHALLLIYAPDLCILTILLKELPYLIKRQPYNCGEVVSVTFSRNR
jgi:hypothetical protein